MKEKKNGYKILTVKPEGNRQLGRPSVDGMIILKYSTA
jgi:hypothetical protein